MNSLTPFDEIHARTQAQAYLRASQFPELEALSSLALRQVPGAPHWLAWLAYAYSMQQKPQQALPLYQQLSTLQPSNAQHWNNLANALCELGHELDALAPAKTAYELGARDAGVYFALARAHAEHAELNMALQCIEQAIAQDAQDIEFRLLRARLLAALDQWENANREMDQLQHLPLTAAQKTDLGYVLLQGGFYQDALNTFIGASEADATKNLDASMGRILCLERLNRLDDALAFRQSINETLEHLDNPKLIQKRQQVDAKLAARSKNFIQAREQLEQLLASDIHDHSLAYSLTFDLAAAHDKCGEVDAAMRALQKAHQVKQQFVHKQHPALVRQDGLLGILQQAPMVARPIKIAKTDHQRDPIFVVGFPRSGTTLLEQLLDAHSELDSFDEQPFLQRRLQQLVAKYGSLNDALQQLGDEDMAHARQQYFQEVAHVLPSPKGAYIVDKNPLNLVRINLAQALFPDAKIILALRHPCDVVLSCYMQNFRALAFAITFETIESTAQMYSQVFQHWTQQQALLNLPIHTLRYEDLVADVRPEAEKLFDFLDLPWQENLLQFTDRAKQKGAISTPSYTQVIEGVNQRAVGRWQPYRSYFSDKAMATLMPWIEKFGYGV